MDWPTKDLVAARAAATPDRIAVIDADRDASRTYREYDAAVGRKATALAALAGADPDRIALLLDTRPAFADLFFAAMRLGATVVPLNVRLTPTELTERIARTDPDVLVCEKETAGTARDVFDGPVASVDESEDDDVQALSDVEGAPVEPASLTADTEQLIMFTSGTTGRPKGVRLTVGNLVASATASAFRLGVSPGDRWLCCLPTYHMGGLAPVVRSALYGSTVAIQREFDAEATAAVLDEYGITGVSLVPTMLSRLLDAGWSPAESLRFVLLGGAPATDELLARCRDLGVPAHPTYGMTETASQIATAAPEQTSSHEGTVGQPLVNTTVTVVDEDGDPVAPGETGEIVVSGPTVTPGYLDPEVTEAAFGELGLHTGDVGSRDEDGRLWIHNRLDDRIVTGGENVDPGEVVAVLRDHPAVEEAAVVGLDDEEWGERVAALVVPIAGRSPSTEEIEIHCRERLAGFKLPRTVGFAEELPRTASGTVDRDAVRERLRDRRE
ncbi:o-succinylbenzoate--CoA ligase [Halorientalis sp. IM1011]|uniref:o-succinylbenzoate--CoA ligase n=1 Tax=Halorientalis sp. IM1011 TaxID=1932360 RepID=UPI00097CCDF3|nr:o-succinylbenzoate--CoA ligase [Halorientalis sp. IM1011]AQL41568.1 o-succinylbenzoate--CoA ligase [Halorientalis sp. IM1011]